MILLGLTDAEKDKAVADYCADHCIRHVVVLSPARFRFECTFESSEHVEYAEIIQYRFFYRLLQEIDDSTLLVINECLRTQERSDLTYNCIRHYLNQTRHQLIFQYLPIVDSADDFMTLVDFDTRSAWKREPFSAEATKRARVGGRAVHIDVESTDIAASSATHAKYAREKRRLIDGLGTKDPHTIPRTLHLLGGADKLAHMDGAARYVGRNNRFKLANLATYRDSNAEPRTVFEFCHAARDLVDFLATTKQTRVRALVTDLKVDQWYLARARQWANRLGEAYAAIF